LRETNLQPSRDIQDALREPPGSLSAEQRRRLKYFLSTGRDVFSTGILVRRTIKKSPVPEHKYVQRGEDDHFGAFISRMPFKLSSKMRIPLGGGQSISVLSVREWGTEQVDSKTKDFREPKEVSRILAIWKYLDNRAQSHGMRVDPWDVFAAIYPPVRKMLSAAKERNNVIYIRTPGVMKSRRFRDQDYNDFALTAWRNKLGREYADGTGLKDGTRSSQTRGVQRPRISTLKNFAGGIAHDAIAGEDYKKEVYRYLFLLTRVIPILSRETEGRKISRVPVVNRDGSLLYDIVDLQVATKYTLCVLPDDRSVASYMASLGDAKSSWPSSAIKSGEFDFKLKLVENRLKVLSLPFFDLKITRDDGVKLRGDQIRDLYDRLENYRLEHQRYTSKRELTGDQDRARSRFYNRLNRFVQSVLRYTHARGTIKARGVDIKFELVPKVSGVWVMSPSSRGMVTVYGSDAVDRKDWSHERMEALITMRAISAHLENVGVEEKDMQLHLAALWPRHLANHFDQAVKDFEELEKKGEPDAKQKASLHIARGLLGIEGSKPYYLDLGGFPEAFSDDPSESRWRGVMRHYYRSQGWNDYLGGDARASELYFQSIRHPHVVYDSTRLDKAIKGVYQSDDKVSDARVRVMRFFKNHRIRTTPGRDALPEDVEKKRSHLVEQGFELYKNYFPYHLKLGMPIPFSRGLLEEIVDRVESQHHGSGVGRDIIWLGVMRRIPQYNAGVDKGERQRLEEYYVPTAGLFRSRFDRFAKSWMNANGGSFPADLSTLMFAARMKSLDEALESLGSDRAKEFLTAWFNQQSKDLDLLKAAVLHGERGIASFVKDYYRVGKIDSGTYLINGPDFENMAVTVFQNRYSSATDGDPYKDAFDVLGERFDPYPEVKDDVAEFLQTGVGHYLEDLRRTLEVSLGGFEGALEAFKEEISSEGLNDFVEQVMIYSDYPATQLTQYGNFLDTILAHRRLLSLLDELDGRRLQPFDPSFKERIEKAFQFKQKVIEEKRRAERAETRELEALARAEFGIRKPKIEEYAANVAKAMEASAALMGEAMFALEDKPFAEYAMGVRKSAELAAGLVDRYGEIERLAGEVKDLADFLPAEEVEGLLSVRTLGDSLIDSAAKLDEEVQLVEVVERTKAFKAEIAKVRAQLEKSEEARAKMTEVYEQVESLVKRTTGLVEGFVSMPTEFENAAQYRDGWRKYEELSSQARDLLKEYTETSRSDWLNVDVGEGGIDQLVDSTIERMRKELEEFPSVSDDRFKDTLDVASVRKTLEASIEQFGTLREMFDTARKSLRSIFNDTKKRLEDAEDNWPLSFPANLPKPIDIPDEPKVYDDGVWATVDAAKIEFDSRIRRKSLHLSEFAFKLALLVKGDESKLVLAEDAQYDELRKWKSRNRLEPLYFYSLDGLGIDDLKTKGPDVKVDEGFRPVRLVRLSRLSVKHPLGSLFKNLKLLARTDRQGLLSEIIVAARLGNDHALEVLKQVFVHMADPRIKGRAKITQVFDRVVLAMRNEVDALLQELGVKNFSYFTREPSLFRRKVDKSLIQEVQNQSWKEIQDTLTKTAEKFGVDAELLSSAEILFKKIDERIGHLRIDHPVSSAWADYIHGNHSEEDWKKTSRFEHLPPLVIEGFVPAAVAWAFIDRIKQQGGVQRAEALGEEFLARLWDVMLKEFIHPDLMARTAMLFAKEYDLELMDGDLIYEDGRPLYDPDNFDKNWDALRIRMLPHIGESMGFAAPFLFEHRKHPLAATIFNQVYGEDAKLPQLQDVVTNMLSEYAIYRYPYLGKTRTEVMDDFQELLTSVYREAKGRAEKGEKFPAWLTVKPDEELVRHMPEIGKVRWEHKFLIGSTEYGKSKPGRRWLDKFISVYPEFVNALAIMGGGTDITDDMPKPLQDFFNKVRDDKLGTMYTARDVFAVEFRKAFLGQRDYYRSLYDRKSGRYNVTSKATMAEDLFYDFSVKDLKSEGGDDDNNGGSTPPTSPSTPSTPSTPPVVSGGSVSNAASIGCRSPSTVLSPAVGSSRPSLNILQGGQYLIMSKAPVLTSARI
jgi:hypothetical protein